jgi:RND family efflux transporter MFP subunit
MLNTIPLFLPGRLARLTGYGLKQLILPMLVYSHFALAAPAQAPLVVVGEARTASVIEQVPLTGTVTSPKVARLSSQIEGQVQALHVEVGDRVSAGDLLLKIDSELEDLALQAARAATRQARAELTDAERRYANARRLREQNTISANEAELLEAEVQIDRATLQRRVAEQNQQRARVEHHSVTAPFDGVISERLTETGEWIQPGVPILTLVSTDNLRAECRVPQEYFMRMDEQSRVKITLDALPARRFDGEISAIVPVSDPSARTFLIHVLLTGVDVKVTPGMSVHGSLYLDTGRQGVVVSRDALLRYPDGRVTVWTVQRSGEQATVSEQSVELGHSFDGKVSITSGLVAGDTIVVEGNESLKEGQAVRIHSSHRGDAVTR